MCHSSWKLGWEALSAIGTISAAWFAWRAITEANRQRKIDQMPKLIAGNMSYPKANDIDITNIGRGHAQGIRITDLSGEIDLLDEHLPISTSLVSGGHASLMLDSSKVRSLITDKKFDGLVDVGRCIGAVFSVCIHSTDSFGEDHYTKAIFEVLETKHIKNSGSYQIEMGKYF